MNYKKYFKENVVELSDRQLIAIKLGGLITAARLHSHLSQAELAKEIGTQQPSLARAEKGEVVPSIEFLYKIAKAIKTEFIFPKFRFMDERENVSNRYISLCNYTVNGPEFHHSLDTTSSESNHSSIKRLVTK